MKLRKLRKKIAGCALGFALGMGIIACSKPETPQGAKDTVIISMDPESEPAMGFDPILGWAAGEHTHDPLIQSTLLITKDDLTIGYDLAKGYTIAPDGLTWTFTIREDVSFSDGTRLTARDVAFTYNQAGKQATETDLSMLDRAEASGEDTVIFSFNKPYSAFAYIAAVVGIVPEESYNPETYGQRPVGSGPYILKQWDRGEQVILESNPSYYGKKGNMKRVVIAFMSEDASYAAAQAGAVDVAYTAPAYTVQPVAGYTVTPFKSVDIRGINLPCIPAGAKTGDGLPAGNNTTRHLPIRQALAKAIDRDALVKDVLLGYGAAAYSDSHNEIWENPAMQVSYSPEEARKIMEAEGWRLDGEGVYTKDGERAEFNLFYMANNSVRTGLAMAVAEMAKEAGIRINPLGSSWDEISSRYFETPHVFGAGMHSPSGMLSHYYTGRNGASYSNPRVDRHLDEALAAQSVEDSYEDWHSAYWDGAGGLTPAADSPWVWLVEIDHIYFVRQGLHAIDQKIHPHGYGWTIVNNAHNWYWD